MKIKHFLISIAVVLPLISVTPASASSIGDCDARIGLVRTQLDATDIVGRNAEKNRTGLERKLDGASTKLSQEKYSDSIQKLTDFVHSVADLAIPDRKGVSKMDAGGAELLVKGANEAIECVAWL